MQKSADLGLDLNAVDETGSTAFHYACYSNIKSVVKVILENANYVNLDLMATNYDGLTGLQIAQRLPNNRGKSIF